MLAQPQVSGRLGILDIREVVLRPVRLRYIDREAALGGEPCERLILGIEVIVVAVRVIDVNGQVARSKVG